MPGTTDPVTTGELVRRFDRMESNVIGRLEKLDSEFVGSKVFDERMSRTDERLKELEKDLDAMALTRRQILTGFTLIVLGEMLVLVISLSNLAARTTGVLQ